MLRAGRPAAVLCFGQQTYSVGHRGRAGLPTRSSSNEALPSTIRVANRFLVSLSGCDSRELLQGAGICCVASFLNRQPASDSHFKPKGCKFCWRGLSDATKGVQDGPCRPEPMAWDRTSSLSQIHVQPCRTAFFSSGVTNSEQGYKLSFHAKKVNLKTWAGLRVRATSSYVKVKVRIGTYLWWRFFICSSGIVVSTITRQIMTYMTDVRPMYTQRASLRQSSPRGPGTSTGNRCTAL